MIRWVPTEAVRAGWPAGASPTGALLGVRALSPHRSACSARPGRRGLPAAAWGPWSPTGSAAYLGLSHPGFTTHGFPTVQTSPSRSAAFEIAGEGHQVRRPSPLPSRRATGWLGSLLLWKLMGVRGWGGSPAVLGSNLPSASVTRRMFVSPLPTPWDGIWRWGSSGRYEGSMRS